VAKRLLTTGAKLDPKSPRSGRRLAFRLRVVTSSGAAVRGGRVTCTASIGRRKVASLSRGWIRGRAYCSWRLPTHTRGKMLRGRVKIVRAGAVVSRSFSKRVR
jgi:hypothetical protein